MLRLSSESKEHHVFLCPLFFLLFRNPSFFFFKRLFFCTPHATPHAPPRPHNPPRSRRRHKNSRIKHLFGTYLSQIFFNEKGVKKV
jgi:hypothetical protein